MFVPGYVVPAEAQPYGLIFTFTKASCKKMELLSKRLLIFYLECNCYSISDEVILHCGTCCVSHSEVPILRILMKESQMRLGYALWLAENLISKLILSCPVIFVLHP